MPSSTPLVCHECWPKKSAHTEPCEHAMRVFHLGRTAGHVEQRVADTERLTNRAKSWRHRANHIFNGKIIAEELEWLAGALATPMNDQQRGKP